MIENNPILKLSFNFSLLVMEYCNSLDALRKYAISKQLIPSGTSIGANAMEAQNAESKADFIHKMKIAAKECDETQYWLTLCNFSNSYPDCVLLIEKLNEIGRILNKILSTSKRKTPFNYLLSFLIF